MIFWAEKAYDKPKHLGKIKLNFSDPEKSNAYMTNNQ